MTIIRKPVPGSKYRPEKDSKVWSQIIDVVNAYHSGRLTKSPAGLVGSSTIKGIAHKQLSRGDLAAADNQGGIITGNTSHPKVSLSDVIWHSNIASIVIAQGPAAVIGQSIAIESSTWTVANLSEEVAEDDQSQYRYAMPDPAEPQKLKASASGMYEILFYLKGKQAVVNTSRSQPFWRYELTSTFNDGKEAEAKLIDIDGNDFTLDERATITDIYEFMDDQAIGDKGICFQSGNKFHALQAVC